MSAADLPGERWRPIAGYEDVYEVSDLGRVRSLERLVTVNWPGRKPYTRGYPTRIMKLNTGRDHVRVGLHRDDIEDQRPVGALVLEAFVGKCPAGLQVMTRDGDFRNVALANLRYATYSEIIQGMRDRGTLPVGEAHYTVRLCDDDVRAIRSNPDGLSRQALASRFGICVVHVAHIIRREKWRHLA